MFFQKLFHNDILANFIFDISILNISLLIFFIRNNDNEILLGCHPIRIKTKIYSNVKVQ